MSMMLHWFPCSHIHLLYTNTCRRGTVYHKILTLTKWTPGWGYPAGNRHLWREIQLALCYRPLCPIEIQYWVMEDPADSHYNQRLPKGLVWRLTEDSHYDAMSQSSVLGQAVYVLNQQSKTNIQPSTTDWFGVLGREKISCCCVLLASWQHMFTR